MSVPLHGSPRPGDWDWEAEPEWALLATIAQLQAELAEVRRIHNSAVGGPPIEWDRWILDLPDTLFLECLGPTIGKDPSDRREIERGGPKRAKRLAGSWGAFA